MNITALKPTLKRIIGKKYTRPILSKVLSNGKELSLTDLETFVTIKGMEFPSGLLDLDGLGLTNKVSNLDVKDFPLFPEITSNDNELTLPITNLELLLESASKDETRLYLNGVAWIGTDLVSTNGHIMTRIQNQTTNSRDSSIMPRASLKELVNLCKRFKISEVTFKVDGSFFQVSNEYFTLMGRLIDREFPKYQAIIPVRTSENMIVSSPVKFKTVKDILNTREAVTLETDNGVTSLVVSGSDFKSELGTSTFKRAIGFNLKYLEFLTNLGSNLKFNNELSPVVVTRGDITRVAMPLKV